VNRKTQLALLWVVTISLLAIVALSGWQVFPAMFRPDPPPTFELGQRPSQAVALDFLQRYENLVARAIKNTPRDEDPIAMSRAAQEQVQQDGPLIDQWHKSGITLFVAAGASEFADCLDVLTELRLSWAAAYPVNGPAGSDDLARKKAYAANSEKLSRSCQFEIRTRLK
jgi:hypothetical protein